MRAALLIAALPLLSCAGTVGGTEEPLPSGPPGLFRLLDGQHDFGLVLGGASRKWSIHASNSGPGTIVLSRIEKLRGGSVQIGGVGDPRPTWRIDFTPGRELEAGSTLIIRATYEPSAPHSLPDRADLLWLRVHVAHTSPGTEMADIHLTGRVTAFPCAFPVIIDFGQVERGQIGSRILEFKNPGTEGASASLSDVFSLDPTAHHVFSHQLAGRDEIFLPPGFVAPTWFEFRPVLRRKYEAFVRARMSGQCAEATIALVGEGV